MEDAVPNQWMQGTLFSDIHPATQCFFEIDKQSTGEPRRRAGTGLDQQIDIAILACVTPRKRAEHPHALDSVPGRDGENGGAFIRA